MSSQLIIPRQLDANGDSASGALAYVYETGTTTPVTVYTDTGLSVAHDNPIEADSAGYFAQAFYGGSTALKVVVTTSAGATLVTYDPVPLVALSTSAAEDISFSPTTEIPQTDVQAAIEEPIVTDRLADSAVTTAKIADDAVTDAKVVNPSGLVFIESQDASASATLDFTGFDSTKYDAYVFEVANLIPATDATDLYLRTSADAGSTYDTGTTDYSWATSVVDHSDSPATTLTADDGQNAMVLCSAVGNGASEDGASFTVKIRNPNLSKQSMFTWEGCFVGGVAVGRDVRGSGYRKESAAVDAVRFLFSSGNITSGTITMYGLRNS